jgi:hypothetical protein
VYDGLILHSGGMDARRILLPPMLALFGGHVLHDLDHVRQGRAIETPVLVLGVLAYVILVAELVLVLRRSTYAPGGALAVGLITAIGFVAVHVVPDWGPLADGYPDANVDALSWAVIFIDIGAASWLALSGWRAWLSERQPSA